MTLLSGYQEKHVTARLRATLHNGYDNRDYTGFMLCLVFLGTIFSVLSLSLFIPTMDYSSLWYSRESSINNICFAWLSSGNRSEASGDAYKPMVNVQ